MSDAFNSPPPSDFSGGGMASAGQPAEFVPRLIAYLIDGVLLLALIIPVFIIGAIVGQISSALGFLVTTVLYLAAFIGWIYLIIMGMATEGQTPGKRMQGIKVTQDSGEPLGVGGAVIRWFVQGISNSIVCGLPLGGLSMFIDADKKTIYDKILNNKAVVVEKGSIMPLFPGGKPF